jgi:deubiquitinase DESI2
MNMVQQYMDSVREVEIRLNVYDMMSQNRYWHWAGVGVYHSGVEVLGKEYAYGYCPSERTGVFVTTTPKRPPYGTVFRESIRIATITKSETEIERIIDRISAEFTGNSYDLFTRNCNHFSNEFCMYLCDKRIPGWVNRLALFGKFLSGEEVRICVDDDGPESIDFPFLTINDAFSKCSGTLSPEEQMVKSTDVRDWSGR